ncbi:MAG: alpha-2-macroglobulin, partial [Lentimicrobiaceae bacterium]|nr:alpha-2-macroglobulin [Lentimicrobiaceae bacterium]
RTIIQTDLPRHASGNIAFTNTGTGTLYVNVVSRIQPIRDTLPEMANNLRINVSYTDLRGNPIDVQTLRQGTDFIAEVRVTNISPTRDFTDVALTHIIPSGWEIFNERMIGDESDATRTAFTHQDIRDDRILTYFDLRRNQTVTVRVRLNAAFVGTFVLPAIQSEAMYDTSAYAKTRAGRVRVVR